MGVRVVIKKKFRGVILPNNFNTYFQFMLRYAKRSYAKFFVNKV